jgi:HK97 gp10 family phage protein
MSLQLRITVEHAADVARELRELFPEALDQHIKDSVYGVGQRMAEDAVRFAPIRTGYLRSTISIQQLSYAKWSFKLVASASYASYVNYGTSRMAPRYFMEQAVNAHTVEMQQAVELAASLAIAETFY